MSTTSLDASQGPDVGLPSKLFTARELGEFALERIGAFSTMDAAPEPIDLKRAIEHMELVIAHFHGVHRLQWLIPETLEFTLEVDTDEYLLSDVAGTSFPSLRVAYPIDATVRIDDGSDSRIDIIRRTQYELIPDKSTSGTPDRIYVDRLNADPRILTYPVFGDSDVTATVRMTVQTYAPSVLGANADSEQSGNVAHGLDRSWQKWITLATACEIGDGPVRQLSNQKLERLERKRGLAETELLGYQNRETHSMRLRRTSRYGG